MNFNLYLDDQTAKELEPAICPDVADRYLEEADAERNVSR